MTGLFLSTLPLSAFSPEQPAANSEYYDGLFGEKSSTTTSTTIEGNARENSRKQATAMVPGLKFVWPVDGTRLTSHLGKRWGGYHTGLDIACPTGTPIRAAARGTITLSGWHGPFGYLVEITHPNGLRTRYAHNSRLLVKKGQLVRRGQTIARSGSTGHSTGPHLHFEVWQQNTPLDPEDLLSPFGQDRQKVNFTRIRQNRKTGPWGGTP